MGKDEKVLRLLEYCARQGYLGKLLELVRKSGPGRYNEYTPRLRRTPRS